MRGAIAAALVLAAIACDGAAAADRKPGPAAGGATQRGHAGTAETTSTKKPAAKAGNPRGPMPGDRPQLLPRVTGAARGRAADRHAAARG